MLTDATGGTARGGTRCRPSPRRSFPPAPSSARTAATGGTARGGPPSRHRSRRRTAPRASPALGRGPAVPGAPAHGGGLPGRDTRPTGWRPPPRARGSGARWLAVGLVVVVVLAAAIGVYLVTRPSGLASETPNQIVQAATTAVKQRQRLRGVGDRQLRQRRHLVRLQGPRHRYRRHGDPERQRHRPGRDRRQRLLQGAGRRSGPPRVCPLPPLPSSPAAWVEAPAGSSTASDFSGLSSLTDVSSTLKNHGTLAAGGTGTVDGQAVVFVKDTTNGGTLAVATSGPAYPVQLSQTSGSGDRRADLLQLERRPRLHPAAQPHHHTQQLTSRLPPGSRIGRDVGVSAVTHARVAPAHRVAALVGRICFRLHERRGWRLRPATAGAASRCAAQR